jgi:energy-coupling factor transporter ATP-binding protein EcfA2
MSVLQEVLSWSKTLPNWQSDAVRRLLAQGDLTNQDIDGLYALLKVAHGIPDPEGRQAQPLADSDIPAPVTAGSHVLLLAIKNLRHVNAIAEGQRLPISETGLTIIYGDNGSGKSGYSRVLKRACRARDQREIILPNAHLPAGQAGAAEAVFEIKDGDTSTEVTWKQGAPSPPELSALSVFDSRCATAYLEGEDDFSYVPFGLDVFERMARLLKKLKQLVDTEHAQHLPDSSAFNHLRGDGPVGQLIAGLSAKTKVHEIDALATISDDELAHHAQLEKSLKEANPKDKATQLRIRARRLTAIIATINARRALVDELVAQKLQQLSAAYRTSKAASDLAIKQFHEQETLLPGTGGEAWRLLFDAAKKYSVESHPNRTFPDFGADSACPLCQQPLAEGAQRLARFEDFIQQEAEKQAQLRRQALVAEYRQLKDADLGLGIDDVTRSEFDVLDRELSAELSAFEKSLELRRQAVKLAVDKNEWANLPICPATPAPRLEGLTKKLNSDAEVLEKASDDKSRFALQQQFSLLEARLRLRQVREPILASLQRMAHQAKLARCLAPLKTTQTSLKASEIAEKVISKDLAAALNTEFRALGVSSLRVVLHSRADKGKALHRLQLELPQARSPGEILSEGEQRAIAIGTFLAEIKLSGHQGGLVFDDPMSSLDHRRRELVAKRLAHHAGSRQVLVFTHDIYFLNLLVEQGKAAGIPVSTQSLTRRPQGYGVADPELPFEGKSVSRRVSALRAQHQEIQKLHKAGDEQEHRRQTVDAYFRLRMAWERAVEEVLFRDVILRFRKGVETQKLSGVRVEDDDYAQIYSGMTKCSNYAHDKAMAGGIAVPEPDELLADIDQLEEWRQRVAKRGEETSKRRKAGVPGA